jgi:serine/threonine protein kinase
LQNATRRGEKELDMAATTEADRYAQQAMEQFGVSSEAAEQALRRVEAAEKLGHHLSVINVLLESGHLTSSQAEQLQHESDFTDIVTVQVADRHLSLDFFDDEHPKFIAGFRLVQRIGGGSMGGVYLVEQLQTVQRYALKVLGSQWRNHDTLLARFQRESQHAAKLNHPNIVRGYYAGFDRDTDRHYFVMEHINGISVHSLLTQRGRLTQNLAVRILWEIAHGLAHAHVKGIIHRDIKPANILIDHASVAKLTDFGLAKDFFGNETSLTKTKQGFGTPFYMAYEQAISARGADHRSDLFSLGTTFYHMLTGRLPFEGLSPLEITEKKREGTYPPASQFVPELSPKIDELLARLLAKKPEERFQSASDLIIALDESHLVPTFLNLDEEVSSTQPTIHPADQPTQHDDDHAGDERAWYLWTGQQNGKLYCRKSSTAQIQKALVAGQFTLEQTVSRSPRGPYRPLREFIEFRMPASTPSSTRRWSGHAVFYGFLALVFLCMVILAVWLWLDVQPGL